MLSSADADETNLVVVVNDSTNAHPSPTQVLQEVVRPVNGY